MKGGATAFHAILMAVFIISASGAWGLQALDAENIVVNGHYLEPGERAAVFKALSQTNGSAKYWVVGVYENDGIRTLIPIGDKDGEIVPQSNLRSDLLSAQWWVQRIDFLKSSSQWTISLTTASKLEELANAVENERFDVEVVRDSIDDNSLKPKVAALRPKLDDLSNELRQGAQDIRLLSGKEAVFLGVTIDTQEVLRLPDEYGNVFSRLNALKDAAGTYDGEVSQVKNAIATAEGLSVDEKSQFIALISPLSANQTLGSAISPYAAIAADNAQRFGAETIAIPTRVAAFDAELETRLFRKEAYTSIHGEDTSLQNTTGFISLQEAATFILREDVKPYWVDQTSVAALDKSWALIQNQFDQRQYAGVNSNVPAAKALVKKIHVAGVFNPDAENDVLSQNIITGLAYLLGGIALLLLIRFGWKYLKGRVGR
ncbi:MAG: hypothetical protein Q8P05_01865 [Candidatus Diapherotrites archaeon]|nr:hypothetical protein [Candidatus Diapherotrites archaeon]MDZ4256437.1 hypothetical protein [archaeon]